jgi:small subunit ribosomal protein S24e
MKLEIQVIEERNNPMLNRREIIFRVIYNDATPSRNSIVDKLAATLNSKQGLVIVDSIKTEFGKRESIGYAKLYDSVERVNEIERSHIIKRNIFENAKNEGEEAGETGKTGRTEAKQEAS